MKKSLLTAFFLVLPLPAVAGGTPSTGVKTVTQPTTQQEKAAIQDVLQRQQRAVIAGDIQALSAVLDDQFTATHITGYVQPKAEWLAQIKGGYFKYHSTQDQGSTITVNGDTATAVGRSVVDVTIGGSRGRWRLESTAQLARKNGEWKIMNSRSSTY